MLDNIICNFGKTPPEFKSRGAGVSKWAGVRQTVLSTPFDTWVEFTGFRTVEDMRKMQSSFNPPKTHKKGRAHLSSFARTLVDEGLHFETHGVVDEAKNYIALWVKKTRRNA
jgi:hypothetical protein